MMRAWRHQSFQATCFFLSANAHCSSSHAGQVFNQARVGHSLSPFHLGPALAAALSPALSPLPYTCWSSLDPLLRRHDSSTDCPLAIYQVTMGLQWPQCLQPSLGSRQELLTTTFHLRSLQSHRVCESLTCTEHEEGHLPCSGSHTSFNVAKIHITFSISHATINHTAFLSTKGLLP